MEDFSLWRSKYTFPKFQICIILLFCVSDGLLWRQPWLNADQNWVSPKPFSSSVVMLRTLKHGSVKSYRQCWMNLIRIQPTYRYFFCHQLMSLWTGCHFCCNTSDLAFGIRAGERGGRAKGLQKYGNECHTDPSQTSRAERYRDSNPAGQPLVSQRSLAEYKLYRLSSQLSALV